MIKTIQLQWVGESEDYAKVVREAVKLKKSGKDQGAIKILQDIYMKENIAYPPAIELLAKLYFITGEYRGSETWLKCCLIYIRGTHIFLDY